MADKADRVTRTAADLYGSAVAEGARQRRSAKQQLDHWARVGCAASSRHTAARQKVEAALAGELALAELSEEEGVVFNAEISAAIHEGLSDALIGLVRPFTAETVFSHPSILELIDNAHAAGYTVVLHVLLIPEEVAVHGVAYRGASRWNPVAENKIRERYHRLWALVARCHHPI
jgi:predicted ABC-type ATPase